MNDDDDDDDGGGGCGGRKQLIAVYYVCNWNQNVATCKSICSIELDLAATRIYHTYTHITARCY